MRFTRRLLVSALVLIALFVGANIAVQKIAEGRIASSAKNSFHTSSTPQVSLPDFPIIFNVLKGIIPRATIIARELKVQDLAISSLTIELRGVHAKLSDLTASKPILVDSGVATASVSEQGIGSYIRSRSHEVSVQIKPGRISVNASVSGLGAASAEGVPKLIGRLLVFHPDRILVRGARLTGIAAEVAKQKLAFEVDVPELPGGIRITGLELQAGSVRMTATFQNKTLGLIG